MRPPHPPAPPPPLRAAVGCSVVPATGERAGGGGARRRHVPPPPSPLPLPPPWRAAASCPPWRACGRRGRCRRSVFFFFFPRQGQWGCVGRLVDPPPPPPPLRGRSAGVAWLGSPSPPPPRRQGRAGKAGRQGHLFFATAASLSFFSSFFFFWRTQGVEREGGMGDSVEAPSPCGGMCGGGGEPLPLVHTRHCSDAPRCSCRRAGGRGGPVPWRAATTGGRATPRLPRTGGARRPVRPGQPPRLGRRDSFCFFFFFPWGGAGGPRGGGYYTAPRTLRRRACGRPCVGGTLCT